MVKTIDPKELLTPAGEIIKDISEVGIDSFLNDGILKDIPLVNSVFAFYHMGKSIYAHHMFRQLIAFLKEVDAGSIPEAKRIEHAAQMEQNPEKAQKELYLVLDTIDRSNEEEKASCFGKLYRAFVMAEIGWGQFTELTEVLTRMFIHDLPILRQLKTGPIVNEDNGMYQCQRLQAIGLCTPPVTNVANGTLMMDHEYRITYLGCLMLEILDQ